MKLKIELEFVLSFKTQESEIRIVLIFSLILFYLFSTWIFTSVWIYLGSVSLGGGAASDPGTDGEERQHEWSTGQTGGDLQVPTSVNTFICLISLSKCESPVTALV